MKAAQKTKLSFVLEVADFFASAPTREQILAFKPSRPAQQRAARLLLKQNAGKTTFDEEWELDQFQHLEQLMRLIRAKARSSRKKAHE
jgi:hypothetical protein